MELSHKEIPPTYSTKVVGKHLFEEGRDFLFWIHCINFNFL